MHFTQLRFVVEQVYMRRRPILEKVNHPLCFRRKMRNTWKTIRRSAQVTLEKRRQSSRTDADSRVSKKLAARQMSMVIFKRVHRLTAW